MQVEDNSMYNLAYYKTTSFSLALFCHCKRAHKSDLTVWQLCTHLVQYYRPRVYQNLGHLQELYIKVNSRMIHENKCGLNF